jgi:hypothetical protein
MKTLKVLFFVALFVPCIARAEASPLKSQNAVLIAEKQQVSGVNNASETGVFSPTNLNKDGINNDNGTLLIAGGKKFPGVIGRPNTPSLDVPNAVTVKRGPNNSGISKVIVSKTVLKNVTSAADFFFLNFENNDTFNNPFTSEDLGEIAFDTNNILVPGLKEVTGFPITLSYDGKTSTFDTFDAANTAMESFIALTNLPKEKGYIVLSIYGVDIGYGNGPFPK